MPLTLYFLDGKYKCRKDTNAICQQDKYAPIYQFKVPCKHRHFDKNLTDCVLLDTLQVSKERILQLNAMLHFQLLRTTCIALLWLTSILPQSFYDSDFQQYHTLNRESREIFVEDTLANLKERTFKLEECNSRHNSTVHANSELLSMVNKRIIPNGTF